MVAFRYRRVCALPTRPGVARANDASIATRNVRHFEGLGVKVIDPWAG
jgi:hypothetical protein